MLFDTNIVIDILAGIPAARVEYESAEDRVISVITWMEVMVGVKPQEEEKVLSFLDTFRPDTTVVCHCTESRRGAPDEPPKTTRCHHSGYGSGGRAHSADA